MKTLLRVGIFLVLLSVNAASMGGEFRMQYFGQRKPLQVSVQTLSTNPSTPCWLWDDTAQRPYVSSGIYDLYDNDEGDFDLADFAYYDVPKNDDVANNDAIPWGVILINVYFSTTDIHQIRIDFRDEDWATNV